MTKDDFKLDINEMAKAGLHFGHKPSKTHPKMKPFIHGTRNNVNIIDLEKTKEGFEKALETVKKLMAEKKVMLLVGTKVQARKLVEDFAKEHGIPFVSERWLGGTITNFDVIKKRIDYYNGLEEKKNKGELDKYTKKEKAQFDLELQRLEKKFKGIRNLEKAPDALFVLDIKKDYLAVKEAREKGIITIGVCDANADPDSVDFPIPASDDAVSAVKYVLSRLGEALSKSRQEEEEVKKEEVKKEE